VGELALLRDEVTRRGTSATDWSLLAVFLTLTVAVPYAYVSREHYFYYWDLANYWIQTGDLAAAVRGSLARGARLFLASFATDYSKLPCVPLVPLFLVLGGSRLVYVVGCGLFYVAPFSLIVGAIATRLIRATPRVVFWTAAFLTLLTPSTWAPTLRGYVDVGAAALIALAMLLWLARPGLRQWRDVALLALLLAASMMFRRHFIYDVAAFLIVAGASGLVRFFEDIRHGREDAARSAASFALRFAALTLLVPVFAAPLIYQVLHHNYLALYAGWEQPLPDLVRGYGMEFGWLFWLLAGVGVAVGLDRRLLAPVETSFVVLVGIVSLVLWMLSARQVGIHFSTHWLWLVPLGLAAFGWSVYRLEGPLRAPAFAAFLLLLAANWVMKLTSLGAFDSVIRPWFASSSPPLARHDYDEVARLVRYLRTVTSGGKAIYVAASSACLNQSMVDMAEAQLYGREHRFLRVLWGSDVDSRDAYPLEGLLAADVVVVATPFQYHLRPERQSVVKVVVDAFNERWEIASDFKELPEVFRLEQSDGAGQRDVRVVVYRRQRPTPIGTAVRTLALMRSRIGRRPGGQLDWVRLEEGEWMRVNQGGSLSVVAWSAHPSPFLYIGTLPDSVRLTGILGAEPGARACSGVSLRVWSMNDRGEVVAASAPDRVGLGQATFSISLLGRGASYLAFDVAAVPAPDAGPECAVDVGRVTVAGAGQSSSSPS
jgi:hypothetical protein